MSRFDRSKVMIGAPLPDGVRVPDGMMGETLPINGNMEISFMQVFTFQFAAPNGVLGHLRRWNVTEMQKIMRETGMQTDLRLRVPLSVPYMVGQLRGDPTRPWDVNDDYAKSKVLDIVNDPLYVLMVDKEISGVDSDCTALLVDGNHRIRKAEIDGVVELQAAIVPPPIERWCRL